MESVRVWKVLDSKTRKSPFLLKANPSLALQFQVGQRGCGDGTRIYACTSFEAAEKWSRFVCRRFNSSTIIVPADGENPVINPPLMMLVRFMILSRDQVVHAWKVSDNIRDRISSVSLFDGDTMPVVPEDVSESIAASVSTSDFVVKNHWVGYGKSSTHVACEALTCLE